MQGRLEALPDFEQTIRNDPIELLKAVGGRDLSVGVPKISLLMKYECYSYCATGCHGSFWSLLCCWRSFWSLLCCWLRCFSRYLSMEFCEDAHMFCVVLQHTPAVFGACFKDWTNVDCKYCGSMSSSGASSSDMSISKVKINQIQIKVNCVWVLIPKVLFLAQGMLGL